LWFPKVVSGLERRQLLTTAPSSPRFFSHRERFGDDARRRNVGERAKILYF